MKKVGILTFHGADNSGAVLQAYALSRFIKDELKTDCEILDYKCAEVEKTKSAKNGNMVEKILMKVYYAIKRKGFDSFRNEHFSLSGSQYTRDNIEESNNVYNTFITGSDQVWNTGCSGNDYTYFLDFVNGDHRKISYAASVGNMEYNEEEQNQIYQLLIGFDAVSVRESSAIVKIGLGDDIPVLPDPVFLLGKKKWVEIAAQIHKKKYVLVYLIPEDVHVMKAAEKYAREHNFDIVTNKRNIHFILKNSPDCFLGWIANAEAVFTNSFHGTAFSIIFGKILGADIELKNGQVNKRIKELLSDAGLEKCVISDDSLEPEHADSEEWLVKMCLKAKAYLASNI